MMVVLLFKIVNVHGWRRIDQLVLELLILRCHNNLP